MAIDRLTNLVKVVKIGEYGGGKTSALLNVSPLKVNYGPTLGSRLLLESAPGLPFIAFDNLGAAFDFIQNRDAWRFEIYTLRGYGSIFPVARVLKVARMGWDHAARAFWAAVESGAPLDGFETRSAPTGSVAVVGAIGLGERIRVRPAADGGNNVPPAVQAVEVDMEDDVDGDDDNAPVLIQ